MASKRILVGASNYGVWAEELQAPWDILTKAGHKLTLATPKGTKPLPLAASVDPTFIDPIQKYNVNPKEVCDRVVELVQGNEWANPIKLSDARMADYDVLVLAGGLGADLDITNNPAVHELILSGLDSGKLICAICFSVASLAFTRDPKDGRKSVVYGKRVTAHPWSWDFTIDVTYDLYPPGNKGTDVVTPGFVLPIEAIMRDAVGPLGECRADPRTNRQNPSVVYDHPFITGCSVESSIAFGQKIAAVLELGASTCQDKQQQPIICRTTDALGSTSQYLQGVSRQVFAHNDNLLLAKHVLDAGAHVEKHQHPQDQLVYMISGRLKWQVGDQTFELTSGDTVLIPGNVPHECWAKEPTVSLDIFNPSRPDFLAGESTH
jgi:putative intracellular protease/amidase/quercetin dioxygenase-like cupin family protein